MQSRYYRSYYRDQARAQRDAFRAQRMQMRGMRRGSVLGPLLLIAVGVVFLLIQSGRMDRHHFFDWYARWWPLLLVGAGLVVLAEWALDQMHLRDPQRVPYRRSVGGGVVVLLLFFAFVGVCADEGTSFARTHGDWIVNGFHLDQDSLDELFGDKHEFDQTLDMPLPTGGSLTIVNPRGDVTVSGTSDDGRMHIAVHKTVFARSDSDAEGRAQQLVPKTMVDSAVTRIAMPQMDGARADLVVTVPADAAVTVNANRGDIHIASIKTSVAATANHGNVELSAITGAVSVDINSSNSSLTGHNLDDGIAFRGHAQDITLADIKGPVTINGEVFGATLLERLNGTVHFHTSRADVQFARLDGEMQISGSGISADQAQGPAVISTNNHGVTLDRVAGDIAITDRNGAIELTAAPALGNITIEDKNGSVKTTLPEHAGFDIAAVTTNGDIDTNFSVAGSSAKGNSSGDDNSRNSDSQANQKNIERDSGSGRADGAHHDSQRRHLHYEGRRAAAGGAAGSAEDYACAGCAKECEDAGRCCCGEGFEGTGGSCRGAALAQLSLALDERRRGRGVV